MTTGFFGATQNSFDMHLVPEPDHVRRFGELLAGLIPARQLTCDDPRSTIAER